MSKSQNLLSLPNCQLHKRYTLFKLHNIYSLTSVQTGIPFRVWFSRIFQFLYLLQFLSIAHLWHEWKVIFSNHFLYSWWHLGLRNTILAKLSTHEFDSSIAESVFIRRFRVIIFFYSIWVAILMIVDKGRQ
jgi:hypothetical protein